MDQRGKTPDRQKKNPGSVYVEFLVDKVALEQVPPHPSTSVFPCQFHHFFTGLHNKPQGCGASVAPAAGPF